MIQEAFWKNKRVLITGHTGFKGGWLTFWLASLGAKVYGIGLEPSTKPNLFSALKLSERCAHSILDIRDRQALDQRVKAIDPEVVFHMAAQPLVRASYANPLETYETNVLGTGNLLWSLKDCESARSIVVVTTDKCYENREWLWGYRENDQLGGHDPYSSSKACTEILTSSFRRSYFQQGGARNGSAQVGLATVRAGNVIGGGDWSEDRLVPDAVRAVNSKATLDIRFPQSIRPWQHVLVPLSGYISLAEKLFAEPDCCSEAFNFAPVDHDCVSVSKVLELFNKHWDGSLKWRATGSPTHHEASFLKLDSSKAKSVLQWSPAWPLERAMSATVEWYRSFYEAPTELASVTERQIADFNRDLISLSES